MQSGSEFNLVDLVNFGVLGILVLLLLTGRVTTKGHLEDEQERRIRSEAKNDAYERVMAEDVLPALTSAVERERRSGEIIAANTEAMMAIRATMSVIHGLSDER